jgi:uncharacterized protein
MKRAFLGNTCVPEDNALFFRNSLARYVFVPDTGHVHRIPDHYASDSDAGGQRREIIRHLGCEGACTINLGHTPQDISDAVDDMLGHMTIGVTRECNFRCDYCVYSGEFDHLRTHSSESMSEATALKAANYFVEHCSKARKELFVTFYGGEPFLNFPVIEKTCGYLSGILKERIHYSITTNGSLLDGPIRRFLVDNRVHLTVSLDGDRDSHDCHRRFSGGRPTFDHVISGLEKLRQEDEAYFNLYVTFAVTVTAGSDYCRLDDFFSRYPNNVKVSGVMFYGSRGIDPVRGNTHNISVMADKFIEGCLTHAFDRPVDRQPYRFAASVISRGLRMIHNRRVSDGRLFEGAYSLKKHCIPGATKLFVSPDGILYPCEKIDSYSHLAIGDLDHGVDKVKVLKDLEEYAALRDRYCRNCYLIDICDYCFQSASNGSGWDTGKMEMHCMYAREEFAKAFELYTEILEKDATALDFLDNQPNRER